MSEENKKLQRKLYFAVSQKLQKLGNLRKSNLFEIINNKILTPDLKKIIVDYTIEDDILKAYRFEINLGNISDWYLNKINRQLIEYDINTVITAYNIYEAIVKMENEIYVQTNNTDFFIIKNSHVANIIEYSYDITRNPADPELVKYFIEGMIENYIGEHKILKIVESELI